MKVVWKQDEPFLTVTGNVLGCSCNVRNEINGLRKNSEIVYSMPDGLPYQPRRFPKGLWKIEKPVAKSEDWLKPWFIPTNASQKLPVWEVRNGLYIKPTERLIEDSGYGFHNGTSLNTWGCCRLDTVEGITKMANLVFEAINDGEEVWAEVI